MKLNSLVGSRLLKSRGNNKRKKPKYATGYGVDSLVYKHFIKDIYEDVPEDEDLNPVGKSYDDMPKHLYHATFTKNVPKIKQRGLLQFQPSNWIKGPGGSRYNEDAGIFAFDDPEDALNWAGKMEWEFRDKDKNISIVRIHMDDEIWGDDPAEDPFVSRKGRALRSGANINADKIIDAISMDDLGKPGDLGISRDVWLTQSSTKLSEGEQGCSFCMIDGKCASFVKCLTPIADGTGPIPIKIQNKVRSAIEKEYPNNKKAQEEQYNKRAAEYRQMVGGMIGVAYNVVGKFGPKSSVKEGDMKADREAGIKYVDDPDWKRLHDMDDKIIQAYIDHKEPKKELTERLDIDTDTYGAFINKYNKKPNEQGNYEGKLHPPEHLKDQIAVKSLEASSFEELKRLAHNWIDKTRESFKPVRNWSDVAGSPTLDLNREFIRDELGVSAEHWIKITELDNGDIALLVAPDDAIADYGLDTVQGENYKRMTIKKTPQGELTNTAASGMSKATAQRLKLTPNGRYTLHRVDRKSDGMGSDIFLMKYDSIVDDPNIPQQLHQPAVTIAASRKLMNSAVLDEGINDPHIFKAVFMAGSPGSGKSYIARSLFGGSGLKVVNSDQVLEYLMRIHNLDPKMPDEEHVERDIQRSRAKELTSKRRENYVDGRLGLIIDGTGKEFNKIAKAKKELEDIGYETRMVFVSTDIKTAQERNMDRPERSVPEHILKRGWGMAQANIVAFKKLFPGDFVKINNNQQVSEEDAIQQDRIHTNLQQWLEHPVANREALDWIDQQTNFSEGLATLTEDACGDCFSKAGRALMDTEEQLINDTTLVHAMVRGQGKLEGRRFPHAWTELGDVVFDSANGNNIVMRKEQYYALGSVEEKTKGAFARYEHSKGLGNMLKHGHWGPWDLDDTLDEEKDMNKSRIAKALDEEGRDYKKNPIDIDSIFQQTPIPTKITLPGQVYKSNSAELSNIGIKSIQKFINRGTLIWDDAAIARVFKIPVELVTAERERMQHLAKPKITAEGDGRKKGIHPKGHPKRQAQQAAIHASESIFSALEKKSNST